ncbi:hypothetical protein B296_00039032 [Ensete ventricosum]|uniref:Uncharacterized protein n=1 Tax=Ensete ventricosum TaxID=4639 RepID=A0A426Z4A3_ENSVE|nr:hypothetical protein B296_00039032 [Ensete ventricosum]
MKDSEEERQGGSKSFLRKKRRSVTSEEWSLVKATQEEAAMTSGESRSKLPSKQRKQRMSEVAVELESSYGCRIFCGWEGPRHVFSDDDFLVPDSGHAARVPHRRRVVGATPFLCRRILWWEQTLNDAGNGSSLTVGAGIVDIDAEATVVSGTIEWGWAIGKAVSGGAKVEERDGDRMKVSSLRDERMGSNGRGGCGGGGNAIVLLLLCARLYERLWQLLHATRRDGTRGAVLIYCAII